jgi:hypothetical protein
VSKKEIMLVALAVILAGVYLCCFTDWLKNKPIAVEHTVRPNVIVPSRRGNGNPVNPSPYVVSFSLGRDCKLTSVKVVPAAEYQTNRNVLPLWYLVGDSRSAPTRSIVYGMPVEGMKPFLAGANVQPLVPGVVYRLLVEAGATRGEHDFKIADSIASHR